MATRNFAKRVNFLVVALMAAVFNVFIASCSEDDPYSRNENETKSVEVINKPVPEGLKLYEHHDSLFGGSWYKSWWTTEELTTNTKTQSELVIAASHAFDENALLDIDKVLDLDYAQSHTTYTDVKAEMVSNTYYEKKVKYSQRATSLLRDEGTQCYLDPSAVIAQLMLKDEYYYMAADSIEFGKAKVVNLRFVDKAMTRAAEYFVDKDHPLFVEVTWNQPVVVVHHSTLSYRTNIEVRDTIMDYPLVKNDITKVEWDTTRVAIDDQWERATINFKYHHKNKEIDESHVNILMKRSIETIPEYTKEVSSFDYRHVRDNSLKIGGTYTPSDMDQEYCTFSERIDEFTAEKTNGFEPIQTLYKYKHQAVRYKNEFVDIVFDFVTPKMSEKRTWVESIPSTDKKYDMARLFNEIGTSYLGYYQEAGETVKLIKTAEGIEDEGFEKLDGTRIVYDDSVAYMPRYYKLYRNGDRLTESERCPINRLHEMLTDWVSIERNANQTTSKLVLGAPTYRENSKTIGNFKFEWEFEERIGSSIASLDASSQDNKGRFIEPMHVKVTYIPSGKYITYTDLVVTASNSASVVSAGQKDGYELYNYRDGWTYKMGDNTLHLTAPGLIKVKLEEPKPDEPYITFKGFTSVTLTVTPGQIQRDAEHLTKWSDGKEEKKNFSLTTNWNVVPTTNWSSIEANNTQSTNSAVLNVTSRNTESKTVNGAIFKFNRVNAKASNVAKLAGSSQNNGWNLTYEEGASSIEYNGDVADFDQLSFSISDVATVTGGNESNGYQVYSYTDRLTASLNGKTQYADAPGEIKVKVQAPEPTITSKGFVSVRLTVNGSTITREAQHVTKWSDGKEDKKNFTLTTNWSVNTNTNWSSVEANNTQSTNSAVLNVTSRNTESKTVNGGVFKFNRVNATAKNVAKLNASNQNNDWTLIYEEGASTIEYDGDVANFDALNFSINDIANVGNGSKSGDYMVYPYTDKLNATLNGQTQSATAKGQIKVKQETPNEPTFFPESWGAIVAAVQTVANNESHKGFVYTWSLRFQNGYVLPVVIRSGSDVPEWNFEFVEKTQITTYNGGTYEAATNKWINTTAADQPNHMIWSRSGLECANKNYNEAKNQNWDDGHLVNGKPSVKTSRYTLSINNGFLSAKDTYTGHVMGTWSSYTGK